MGNFKKIFISFTVLGTIFCMFACKEESGAPQTEKLGLQWSEKAPLYMDLHDAHSYCEDLNEGGYNDWRLPNIDELRKLIINCPKTETNGSCNVTELCLKQKGPYQCENRSVCKGCGRTYGTSYSRFKENTTLWSNRDFAVAFEIGAILYYGEYGDGAVPEHGVRCVRGQLLDSSEVAKESTDAPEQIKKTGNLQWSKKSSKSMDLISAVNYCNNLSEGEYSDWKLPNIDELRMLIKNHSGTETGGSCKISEKNSTLSIEDWISDDCNERYGYDFSKLGDYSKLWSHSSYSEYSVWYVDFAYGTIYKMKPNNYWGLFVRCVRKQHSDTQTSNSTFDKSKRIIGKLQWSKIANSQMSWKAAEKYCKKLNEDGFRDWHLPTISELQTLIQNCSETEKGCKYDASGKYNKLGDVGTFWAFENPSSHDKPVIDFTLGSVSSIAEFYEDMEGFGEHNSFVRCVRNAE